MLFWQSTRYMFLDEMAAFGDDQAAGDDRAAALGSNFERTRKANNAARN
jgi:hypothetical protein